MLHGSGSRFSSEEWASEYLVSYIQWPESLKPYYPLSWTNRDYHCPGYKSAIFMSGQYGNVQTANWYGSYGYNALGSLNLWRKIPRAPTLGIGEGLTDYDSSDPHHPKYPPPISESQVKAPSEMLAMGDSRTRKLLPEESRIPYRGGRGFVSILR
jgi:hypothetical protein